jgi:hypothetical protein
MVRNCVATAIVEFISFDIAAYQSRFSLPQSIIAGTSKPLDSIQRIPA